MTSGQLAVAIAATEEKAADGPQRRPPNSQS
jgi:hypothetical protein